MSWIPATRVSLTANGVGYLGSIAVIFFFAVNYSSNLLFMFCFVLVGVATACFWLNTANIKALQVLSVTARPVHEGQVLVYSIDISDEGGRDHQDLQVNGQRVPDVMSGERQQWQLTLRTDKRGLRVAEPLRVSSRWPLGLFKSGKKLTDLPAVMIYPRIAATGLPRHNKAVDSAHLYQEADSLMGLKEYQPGDNTRRIDWRAMARREQLQVKVFDGAEGDASIWFDWDDVRDLPYEQRISRLCRWIVDSHKQGVEFGLRLPGFGAAPANSHRHLHQCLYRLAMMPQQAGVELKDS